MKPAIALLLVAVLLPLWLPMLAARVAWSLSEAIHEDVARFLGA